MSFVLAMCGLLAGMAPARAQTPQPTEAELQDVFDRGCGDDNGRDLCDRAVWADIVARFGFDSAELAQRQGLRGVRVFAIDGHGNEMPVVSILATRFDEWGYPETGADGQPKDAELEVRWRPFRDGDKAPPAPLQRKAWFELYETAKRLQSLVAASPENLAREPVAKPDADGNVLISICHHPWVTVTESLTADGVMRRVRAGCASDPVREASFGISDQALRGFPVCNHLDPAILEDASSQLLRCLQLEGPDRFAAADVANVIDALSSDVADLGPHLAPKARLAMSGRAPVSGATKVAAALADPALADMHMYTDHHIGDADRVTTKGRLDRYVDESSENARDDGRESADIEITWRRHDETWRIEAIVIGEVKFERYIYVEE